MVCVRLSNVNYFQACTGIDDFGEAILYLEETNWDLLVDKYNYNGIVIIAIMFCTLMLRIFLFLGCDKQGHAPDYTAATV